MVTIDVPDLVRDGAVACLLSLSGGKDSEATALALKEAGVAFRMVFADGGWEARETYAHLDHVREVIGPVDVVGRPGGLVQLARKKAGFPHRRGRWCTEKLKIEPLREYHDRFERETGLASCSVVGIRAEESAERAKFPVWEDCDRWGGFVWRPILGWSVADVIAIHHRHGLRMNPLYLRGHNRVGCYPCIMANKDEIRLVAKHAPERIDEIDRLEREFTEERARRNEAGEGNFAHPRATFFMPKTPGEILPIRDAVRWSRTTRGGRQLSMLEPDDGGCFRWGMCEPPSVEPVQPATPSDRDAHLVAGLQAAIAKLDEFERGLRKGDG